MFIVDCGKAICFASFSHPVFLMPMGWRSLLPVQGGLTIRKSERNPSGMVPLLASITLAGQITIFGDQVPIFVSQTYVLDELYRFFMIESAFLSMFPWWNYQQILVTATNQEFLPFNSPGTPRGGKLSGRGSTRLLEPGVWFMFLFLLIGPDR